MAEAINNAGLEDRINNEAFHYIKNINQITVYGSKLGN